MQPSIWTIGHSTRTPTAFRCVLAEHSIELVVDVRRFPGSRHAPHFNTDPLRRQLARAGIHYRWIPELGGRRRASPTSINAGWRHPAFRGYADHIATEEFALGLTELVTLAGGLRVAVMCAELLWWRCHRRIIADVLSTLGFDVIHLRDGNTAEMHRLAPPARLEHGRLTYAPLRRQILLPTDGLGRSRAPASRGAS